jgi:hypothetical protein
MDTDNPMDIDCEQLASRLEEIRRALIAAETYLVQIRIAVPERQADVARLASDRGATKVPPCGP